MQVTIAAGKYYLNKTLTLGAADSHVSYTAAGGGGKVVVSGGILLSNLDWKPSPTNPKVLVADVTDVPGLLSAEERAYWTSFKQKQQQQQQEEEAEQEEQEEEEMQNPSPPPHPHPHPHPPPPPIPHKWGSPPALWNTLHVDGARQVRARYPNGNPQDNTGKCFSKTQYPNEGCPGYMSAKGGAGSLPGSTVVHVVSNGLNRNNAPLSPTTGGGSWGTFKYAIFDPPAGHPVSAVICLNN